ncbi:fucose permease [Fontibacillus phaseoli]|uniref:Fucose permease n=1 Tax=Fontibacillus phaseoli TaxID=1416533 RepID=A0A369BPM5_9BACL|nr:MFS transporter [Fontibacillus phaseoli]RCX23015.1 fucose permease [Fontibacillus phaseoli]
MELTAKLVNKKLLTPTFVSLWIIMFLVEFVKGALIVAILPVYMGDVLKLSAFAIGLSFSCQYIGDNLFRSPAGWLIERIGFRLTMTIGLCITFGAVFIITVMKTMGFIVLGCALLGIGTAPLWPCVLMGITAVTEENKNFGTAMGVIQISSLGGTGLGPVIINFLVSVSYTLVFWVLLGCMGLVILVSLFLPRRTNRPEDDAAETMKVSGAPAASAGAPDGLWRGGLARIWQNIRETHRNIRTHLKVSPLLYPALFLQSFAVGLLTPVITLFVRSELGLSPEAFSLMLITGGGVTVLGLIPIGKLVDRYGTRRFLNTGFALAAVSVGLFAFMRPMPVVWLLVMLIGVSYAFILPTWDTMISHLLPEGEKGTVWGLFLTIQGSGMVVGPIVSGKMWDALGAPAPFLASSISMALLFFIHLFISRKQPAPPGVSPR